QPEVGGSSAPWGLFSLNSPAALEGDVEPITCAWTLDHSTFQTQHKAPKRTIKKLISRGWKTLIHCISLAGRDGCWLSSPEPERGFQNCWWGVSETGAVQGRAGSLDSACPSQHPQNPETHM
ncbi:hypothetical protein H1C71_018258, partial [Ictidomys tridecemlineatus]